MARLPSNQKPLSREERERGSGNWLRSRNLRELRLLELAVTVERLQERHQVALLRRRQFLLLEVLGVEVLVGLPAAQHEVDRLLERGLRAVVEVGARLRDIAERRGLERAGVLVLLGEVLSPA